MSLKVDHHVHTYYSDGQLSPAEIVEWAYNKGLDQIAITDHDGTGGVKEAAEAGKLKGITVIPGIEFSTEAENGVSLHILGYNIDIDNSELAEACHEIRLKRQARNEKFLKALNEEGYALTAEDLVLREGQDFIGKPIFARALVRKGYISEPAEAFEKVFTSEKLRAIRKEKIPAKRAIELIGRANGTAVLAHPGLIRNIGERGSREYYANLERLLKSLKKYGLAGMECNYSKHTKEEEKRFKMANKFNLHITSGSDYHGPDMQG